jgi:hypothetical protein
MEIEDLLSEKGRKEVNKEHAKWKKEMLKFLFLGFVFGFILGILL